MPIVDRRHLYIEGTARCSLQKPLKLRRCCPRAIDKHIFPFNVFLLHPLCCHLKQWRRYEMADILQTTYSKILVRILLYLIQISLKCVPNGPFKNNPALIQIMAWRRMMTSSIGNIFRVTGPLCGEFTGDRWIPLTKASDAELWCFLSSVPE